jgi:GTPase SAR1 family protein
MQIAIIGTHGTGKTTLLNELVKMPELKNYKVISEIPRKYLEDNNLQIQDVLDSEGLSNQFQLHNWSEQWEQEGRSFDKDSEMNFISDRSLFDVMAYAMLSNHDETRRIGENCYKELTSNRIEYDLLIYIPIEWEMSQEDVSNNRCNSEEYRQQIDKKIFNLVNDLISSNEHDYGCNTILVEVKGSVEERVTICTNLITTILENENSNISFI